MAAVAPPPAPAPAPAAPAAAAAAADQATDLLQKISLDSQTKTQDATDATKKHGAVNSAQPLSVSIPSERSLTPLLQDFTDPNLFYLPAYYYGGYDGSMNEWDDYPRYVNPDGVEITPAVYGDIYHGYGYAPYGAYSAASSPVPTLGHDGQMFGPQHYQYPAAYYQPPTPAQAPNQAAATQGELPSSVAADKPPAQADTAKPSSNGVANGTAHGNSGSVPLGSSHQNSALTHNGTYGRAPLLSGLPATGYLDSAYGFDGTGTHYRWFDAPAYQSGQHRPTTTSSVSSLALHNTNTSSARNQNKSPSPQPTGVHTRRPTSAMGAGVTAFSNRMYANARPYSQYGNSLKTGLAFGSNGYDARVYGRWGLGIDNRYRPRGRGNGLYGFGNENQDGTVELNRGPRSGRFKNQKLFGHTVTIAVKGQTLPSIENKNVSVVPDRAQFNRDDFPEQYADAKFFIIKSYSEDDIHKSIKYNFWASTTNGNKKLDAAYQEAQAKGSPCPIFLFFSVNTSGQFVGVAEMTGRVDFDNTLEYWQQDKWNGSFPVKWHIVKDVPNNILKHITLENNENKPVTNSRDTQEVNPEQGIQVLKIFKEHVSKTSILDDFGFYENRQKLMQEKRVKQQQLQKQVWDARTPDSITGEKEQDGVNGKPRLHEPLESISNLNKETTMVVGEMKVPAGNGVAPLPTYASKVAQTASEKPALANGVTKTG